jgi:hypothetical protein
LWVELHGKCLRTYFSSTKQGENAQNNVKMLNNQVLKFWENCPTPDLMSPQFEEQNNGRVFDEIVP